VGLREIRWDKGGNVREGDYNFFSMEKERISSIGNMIFVHHRIVSTVKRL